MDGTGAMWRQVAVLVGLLGLAHPAVALGAPKQAATPATAAEVAQCKSLCEARDNVSCPNSPKEAACNANCAAFAVESGGCRAQFDAWLDDLSKATWTCDGNGYPHYSGSATGVQSGFFQCSANVIGGSAKARPTLALCGVSSDDAYCDNSLAFSCSVQAVACGGNAECRAIESCLDKCPNSNSDPKVVHACIGKCKSKHAAGLPALDALDKCAGAASACGGPTGPNKSLWDQLENAPAGVNYGVFKYCTLIAP